MPQWSDQERYEIVRHVKHDEVKCYTDWEFYIQRYDEFDLKKHERKEDPYSRTYGENIDLFDLQEWFDKNRAWIDTLRQEVENEKIHNG